jgi:hypothetical protein
MATEPLGPAEEGAPQVEAPAQEEAPPPEEAQQWVQVDSSAVAEVGFNEEAGEITVVWNSGQESTFEGDRQTFESLAGAGSVGKAVNDMMGRTGSGRHR